MYLHVIVFIYVPHPWQIIKFCISVCNQNVYILFVRNIWKNLMYEHCFVQWITYNSDFSSFVHLRWSPLFSRLSFGRWWWQGGGVILPHIDAVGQTVAIWFITMDILLYNEGKLFSILSSVSVLGGAFCDLTLE